MKVQVCAYPSLVICLIIFKDNFLRSGTAALNGLIFIFICHICYLLLHIDRFLSKRVNQFHNLVIAEQKESEV